MRNGMQTCRTMALLKVMSWAQGSAQGRVVFGEYCNDGKRQGVKERKRPQFGVTICGATPIGPRKGT